jgi:AcrR family transcriptional regulator
MPSTQRYRSFGVLSTLLRHFETKERLIVAVVEGICTDLVSGMTDRVGDLTAPTQHVLRALRNHLCAPDERCQFLLLFELVAANAREPGRYGQLSTLLIDDLLAPVEQNLMNNGHKPTRARELATSTLAQIRGLQLDLAISNDRERVDQAMFRYIDMIATPGRP